VRVSLQPKSCFCRSLDHSSKPAVLKGTRSLTNLNGLAALSRCKRREARSSILLRGAHGVPPFTPRTCRTAQLKATFPSASDGLAMAMPVLRGRGHEAVYLLTVRSLCIS
jgi:hypothetical protein